MYREDWDWDEFTAACKVVLSELKVPKEKTKEEIVIEYFKVSEQGDIIAKIAEVDKMAKKARKEPLPEFLHYHWFPVDPWWGKTADD